MGIGYSLVKLLLEEKKQGRCGGRILQLGRQHTFLTVRQLNKLLKKNHLPLVAQRDVQLSFNPHLAKEGFIDDHTLFKALGFTDVYSLDYSAFEGADIIVDLNNPISTSYEGFFDLILDSGTTEHVFNLPQALKNIHSLLKIGGHIIHVSPSHNHVDHGFYMFSPTLLYEYYQTNNYKILTSYIFEYSCRIGKSAWHIYNYIPGSLEAFSLGGFGKNLLGIYFVAQKLATSTSGMIPQQGYYQSLWAQKNALEFQKFPLKRFLKILLPTPFIKTVMRWQARWTRRLPKKIGKY